MNDREFESVLALAAESRYEYCVKRAIDWECVWSLRDAHGWALASDDDGNALVPIWPHPRFAQACAGEGWREMQPARIVLDAWIDRCLPGIETDERLIAVFATPVNRGVVVSPEQFGRDLAEELAKY